MGQRVSRVKTNVSASELTQAISQAWQDIFGTTPTHEQVSLLLAQNALETGNRKAMWNYNIGNITTDGKGSYDYFDDLTTNEQTTPGSWKKMNLKYRAYPSLEEGAKDYLKFISGKRYAGAWQHILNPDPAAFSKALKEKGYYTANEKDYTRSLSGLYNQFHNKSPGTTPVESQLAQHSPLNELLDKYLQSVLASQKSYKQLYKNCLPHHQVLIQVQATNYTDAVEFARILSSALEEELLAKSFVYTDQDQVEIECQIAGPSTTCFEAVKQLTHNLQSAFKTATQKIGGIDVLTHFAINKRSSYQPINLSSAQMEYRKFLLKFMGKGKLNGN